MITMKPRTRCKRLAQDIKPLAEHIAMGYSPSVDRISVRREDWDLLHEQVEAARAEGFTILENRITFRGIEVVPRAV